MQESPERQLGLALPDSPPVAAVLPARALAYPEFRYMGSKHRLLPWIHGVLSQLDFETASDPFVGSGCVAYLLKSMGKQVQASDFLNFPVTLATATLKNSVEVLDTAALRKLLVPVRNGPDFIARTFRDVFFTLEDLNFLDMVCANIEKLATQHQRALARAALLRSCITQQSAI